MAQAYVGFERGLQASLNGILNTITTAATQARLHEGYFYLTTDTNRLYVCKLVDGSKVTGGTAGTNYKTLIELNQSITFVSDLGQLPSTTGAAEVGQFYYVEPGLNGTGNILCVYTSTGWHQINADHRIDPVLQNTTVSTISGGGGVFIESTVQDNDNTSPNQSIGSFKIVGEGNISVSRDSTDQTKVIISSPPGSDTQYDLTSGNTQGNDGATITLADRNTGNAHEEDTITITGDGNHISVSESNGTITITGPNEDATSNLSFNANGVLSARTDIDGNTGLTSGTNVTPTISFGHDDANSGAQTTSAVFASGTAVLDVYTAAQTEAKINSAIAVADAMTYCGVINLQSQLPSGNTTIHKGDTYKVNGDITVNGETPHIGDLIIYNGSDSNTVDATAWDIVPSGNDQLISVIGETATNKFRVYEGNLTLADLGSLSIVGATNGKMSVTSTGSGTNNKNLTITIDQDASYTPVSITESNTVTSLVQQDNSTATFTALTALTTDAYGNVVSAASQTFTVTDTHANIKAVEINASNYTTDNTLKIETKVTDTDDVYQTGQFLLTSNSLTLSYTNGTDTSGNPQDIVQVDMIWGSFDPVTP